MNRRSFLKRMSISAAAMSFAGSTAAKAFAAECSCRPTSGPDKRPNILFIFSDDHAQNTISAYGSVINQTPNIDRIANEGAVFKNSFCGNSICQPSRASVMTGKHSHLNGIIRNGSIWRGRQETFPKLLARKGYQTALIGKWHLDPDPKEDEFGYWQTLTGAGGQGDYYNPTFNSENGQDTVQGYSTDIITDKAIDWLDNARDPDDPFMLMVQFKSPHVPRRPAIRDLHLYENETIPEPPTLYDDYSGRLSYASNAWMAVSGIGNSILHIFQPLGSSEPQEQWFIDWFARLTPAQQAAMHEAYDARNTDYYQREAAGEFNDVNKRIAYNYQRMMQGYLACVKAVDDNIGRLLAWLDSKGLAENTVVVYASDQSYFVGEHSWMEKRWMYEESLRMPFVMRWPKKIAAGTQVNEFVQNIDYAPTLLEIAGQKIPTEIQGRSLMPLLTGQTPVPQWRDSIYYHYYQHGGHNVPRHDGVRTDRYKLIHFYTDDAYEMYDLLADPHELNSVYDDPVYASIKQDMLNRLEQLRQDYEVPPEHYVAPYAW